MLLGNVHSTPRVTYSTAMNVQPTSSTRRAAPVAAGRAQQNVRLAHGKGCVYLGERSRPGCSGRRPRRPVSEHARGYGEGAKTRARGARAPYAKAKADLMSPAYSHFNQIKVNIGECS